MRYLVSLPEAGAAWFAKRSPADVFVASDPGDRQLGSGGGTVHLLLEAWKSEAQAGTFAEWLAAERRIITHASGMSRRLPAYAPIGKALLPLPVFRWSRAQRLRQTLLDAQRPLLDRLMEEAPPETALLVASGDVLIRNDGPLPPIPRVDVACVGLWTEPETAVKHGVFFTRGAAPSALAFVRQKPSLDELQELAGDHVFMIDTGIWLFTVNALRALCAKCGIDPDVSRKTVHPRAMEYDLYSSFGEALGLSPTRPDAQVSALSSALLPLSAGGFFHFGATRDIVRSAARLQNLVLDQSRAAGAAVRRHPDVFVQNARLARPLDSTHGECWIENSFVSRGWRLRRGHVITGAPENDWRLDLPAGVCLDFIPVGEREWCVRPYEMGDAFRGAASDPETRYLGEPLERWMTRKKLTLEAAGIDGAVDMYDVALFPVHSDVAVLGEWARWMIAAKEARAEDSVRQRWIEARRLSCREIAREVNIERLNAQRDAFRRAVLPVMESNARKSVFYRVDLRDMAADYIEAGHLPPPQRTEGDWPLKIANAMFRSLLSTEAEAARAEERRAFGELRRELLAALEHDRVDPCPQAHDDQIVWARSPVRLDMAGGWSDTPPYCLLHGGSVVNVAVELNGQPPLQVFVRLTNEIKIVLRSIDLGLREEIETFEELADHTGGVSPFAIPKAALCLAGFHPAYCRTRRPTLRAQLASLGAGLDLSLLSAVPRGSGLGTSSILGATALGALNELCGLRWDVQDIGRRTLLLEQMMESGGGWQDQYGGIFRGVKLLETAAGLDQRPTVRWLPEHLLTGTTERECVLLYYTGITRVARGILAGIVRNMFLNESACIETLDRIREHAAAARMAFQSGEWRALGAAVRESWRLNRRLDSGTDPASIQAITALIDDYCEGFKLLGAGGGGFLLMLAKDTTAAGRIRKALGRRPPNSRARFVEPSVSEFGLQVTRS